MISNESLREDAGAAGAGRGRTARTRKALCSALLALLEEQPFDQIRVKEITERAEVGYATFFRRYKDKEDLLHDLASQEIHRLLTMTLPLLYSVDSQASTRALCAWVWEHRRVWKTLLAGGAASILKEEYLQQALELATAQPNPEASIPDDLAVTFAVTAVIEILTWWLKQERPAPVSQVADYLDRLAVAPILSQSEAFGGG